MTWEGLSDAFGEFREWSYTGLGDRGVFQVLVGWYWGFRQRMDGFRLHRVIAMDVMVETRPILHFQIYIYVMSSSILSWN